MLQASTDPTIKLIGDQLRTFPERRITNSYQVADIAEIVRDNYVFLAVTFNPSTIIRLRILI